MARTRDETPDGYAAAVAVLWGEGGTCCAGADLKAIGTRHANRVTDVLRTPYGETTCGGERMATRSVGWHV